MPVSDKEVQAIIDNPNLSNNEILDKVSSLYMSDGYIVTLRTNTQLQLIRKKEFSLLWAFLWVLVWGVGLLFYIFYYMAKKDEHVNITLDEEEKKNKSSIKELSELSQLFKDGHLTQEEFEKQKKIILS